MFFIHYTMGTECLKFGVPSNRSLSQIQARLDELGSEHNLDVDIIREVLGLARNIHLSYRAAPFELKRHFLALFWERFMVQDKEIVEATPTKLIQALIENKQVIIKDSMSRG